MLFVDLISNSETTPKSADWIQLRNGKNIVKLPHQQFNNLTLIFRTDDYKNSFIEISSVNLTSNINYGLIFAYVFLGITIFFAIALLLWGITKDKRHSIHYKLELWISSRSSIICFILSFVSTIGLSADIAVDSQNIYNGSDNIRRFFIAIQASIGQLTATENAIIFFAVFSLIKFTFRKLNKKLSFPALILSLFFSFFTIMGDCFYQCDSWDLLFSTENAQIVINITKFTSLFILFYTICSLLLKYTEVAYYPLNRKYNFKFLYKLQKIYNDHPISCIAVLILLFWSPYFVIYFPGIIPSDTVKQIGMHFSNYTWTDHWPVFSTFTFNLPLEIGRILGSDNLGVFLFTGTQTIILAILLSYCINFLKVEGGPPIIYKAWLISILVLPVYPCNAIQMGKDTNYTICILILILALYKIVKNPDEFFSKTRNLLLFTLTMIYMCLVRHNGIYILISSIGVIFLCIKNKKNFIRISACFLCAIFIFSGYKMLVPAIVDYNNSNKGIVSEKSDVYEVSALFSSVVHNTMGRIVLEHKDDLTDEQLKIINTVYYDAEDLANAYRPEISDYTEGQWRTSISKKDYSEFKKLFIELAVKYPDVLAETFFNKCYSYFYCNSASKEKSYVWYGINSELIGMEEVNINNNSIYYNHHMQFFEYMNAIMKLPIFSVLSYVGIYSWMIIFSIVVVLNKKQYKSLLVIIPLLASLAVCVMSPVNGYIRYALPVIYSSPLLLSLCFEPQKNMDITN